VLTVAAYEDFGEAGREAAEATGRRVEVVVAPPGAIERAIEAIFGPAPLPEPATPPPVVERHPELDDARRLARATDELRTRFPEESASRVLSDGQRVALAVALVVILIGLVLSPAGAAITLIGLATVFYLAVLLHRCVLAWRSLRAPREVTVTREEMAAVDDAALPTYTVLVPLRREAAVVPRLVAGLSALDYPTDRLEIRLLCEVDDRQTLEALEALRLPEHFEIVRVPAGRPRTKPKACNFGLLGARGELVVVYDAEDRPEPDQLRRAAVAFSKVSHRVMCLQARLASYNANQNLLTRWFEIEFATWFGLLLPGLHARHRPIPLGGSSNHLRTAFLRELAAWDPFNVTEDADLGTRLHRAGLRTAMLDSTTLEEANPDLRNWVRQRSRWSKGYVQTWLVHMRHPVRLARQLGLPGFLSFQLVVGGIFVPLLNPVFWLLTTAFFIVAPTAVHDVFPRALFAAAGFSLLVGNIVFVLLAIAGALHRRAFGLVRYALVMPLYWGLMSLAAWRGLLQLVHRPFLWEKTTHGLDEGRGG